MRNNWWKKAVIYQVYPKSFCDSNADGIGDLNGIKSKLPYLKELGVDAIWLSPIYLSPQVDNGYDVQDYYKIDPMFGTNEEMYALIERAHEMGIKVIMDFVANHTSDQAYWFQESRKSRTNPYSDYYIWRDAGPNGEAPNNWGSNFGGSAWTWNETRQQYYLHYYASEQPDLNWENPKVRQAIYDVMKFWKEKGVDGWRLDVITSISKDTNFPDNPQPLTTSNQQNGPRMHEFLHELNKNVFTPYDMMTVGEAPASKAADASLLVDPKREELDMVFTFEHMHIDRKENDINGRWALQKPNFVELKSILSEWQKQLRDRGWNALYFENHDRARVISRWGNDTKYRYESATAFATVLHGLQGTPFIYQGEEIGMTNADYSLADYDDIELKGNYQFFVKEQKTISEADFLKAVGKVSRDHARTPMQWNVSKNAGFSEATPWLKVNSNYKEINVDADRLSTKSIFKYYQKLIQLRHREEILTKGSYELLLADHPSLFVYRRKLKDKTWLVVANLTDTTQTFNVSEFIKGDYKFILKNYAKPESSPALRPFEAYIIEY